MPACLPANPPAPLSRPVPLSVPVVEDHFWLEKLFYAIDIFLQVTVKPMLTTTSEQQPLAYNSQPDPKLFNFDSNF